ncbi:MAG TPA: indole-3-glycerol phosphate synthase TrpC [Dehalococcoidia bacterium]|nr:indole-3-glycerol phosphate synthase TrpC [Dehalococcoidia bacterium]
MILEKIVQDNLAEFEARKRRMPLERIKEQALQQPLPLDFAAALQSDDIRIIAEVKKASPSRGIIRADFDPVAIAVTYAAGGAAAISVITEELHFEGSLDYLKAIDSALKPRKIPLLRKDFIHDPYQIYESRAYGADAVLLIVAMLQPEQLNSLLAVSHESNLHCLVEVHNERELEIALDSGARCIGINNRDLKTFTVDISTTERLCPLIPKDRTIVSESGIKTRWDMQWLKQCGVHAALIGEALVASTDIKAKLKELQ